MALELSLAPIRFVNASSPGGAWAALQGAGRCGLQMADLYGISRKLAVVNEADSVATVPTIM